MAAIPEGQEVGGEGPAGPFHPQLGGQAVQVLGEGGPRGRSLGQQVPWRGRGRPAGALGGGPAAPSPLLLPLAQSSSGKFGFCCRKQLGQAARA